MDRRRLVDILKKVQPAVTRKDYIPAFSYFWFDGRTVTGYNDFFALQAPCAFDVRGGIRRMPLLGYLVDGSSGSEVSAVVEGQDVVITVGDSSLKTRLLPREELPFAFPTESSVEIDVGESLIEGLIKCAVSMGLDPAFPSRLGITVVFSEEQITLYSSDNFTGSRAIVRRPIPLELVGRAFVAAFPFWKTLIELDKNDFTEVLHLTDDWIEARFQSGVRLWAKTVKKREDEDGVKKFAERFDGAAVDDANLIPIPNDFDACLRRTLGVLETERLTKYADLCVVHTDDGPKLVVQAQRCAGAVRSATPVEYHEECSVGCQPEFLLRVLKYVDEWCILADGLIAFRGPGFQHLIASRVEGEHKAIKRRLTQADRGIEFLDQLFRRGAVRRSTIVKRAAKILGLCWANVEKMKKPAGIVSERTGGYAATGHWDMRSLRPVRPVEGQTDPGGLTGLRRKFEYHRPSAAQLAYRIAEYEIDPPAPEPPEAEEYWERLAADRST